MNKKNLVRSAIFLALVVLAISPSLGQDPDDEDRIDYSFGGDITTVSKYIWRGQRLTNDWSLQPSGTVGFGNFSFNIWGSMDLTSVNEGDVLYLSGNPMAPSGDHNGLQGKFSEVDFTMAYGDYVGPVSVEVGTIFYTFPGRSASLPTTAELYGSLELSDLPFAPSATLYVDVDETSAGGDTGLYLLFAGGHSFSFGLPRFPGIDLSSSLGVANGGFGIYYYGVDEAGLHDFSFTVSAPLTLTEKWSMSGFVTYSTLLGEFRNHQYRDQRAVYLGKAGSPATFADTVWGGVSLSLEF